MVKVVITLEGKVIESELEYVEGGIEKDGKVTFHIESDDFQVYLEFKDEEEFNQEFLNSLKEQIEEDKQRLKEQKKKKF